MRFFLALIFGIIEGITEWLPISSTGHLRLLNSFIKFDVSQEFYTMFEVVIQLGAIFAVIVLFWNKLWPFSSKKENHYIKKDIWIMWFKILVACIPAVFVVVFDLDKYIEDMFYTTKYEDLSISIALIVVGIIFIIVESINKKEANINDINNITYKTAFIIGVFQVIAALFPGVSRSGATIIGALMIGVSRKTAADFTFYLAVPAMIGASAVKLLDFGVVSGEELVILAIGMLSAFIVSIFVIKFLLSYIKKHDFKVFAYYRIVLGIIILALWIL